MKKAVVIYFLFSWFLSCSTAPEFDRGNKNDPISKKFIPDISDFSLTINPDKTVSLNWSDDSEYEEGFVISKSFENDSNFVFLDTIPSNTTSYIDSSKSLAVKTFYKISAFSETVGENNLPGIIQVLNFGSFQQVKADAFGNRISLNWNSDLLYADRFLIEKKQPESEIWETVQTTIANSNSLYFQDLNESYFIDVRITAQIESNTLKFETVDIFTLTSIDYNLPSNFDVEITSEATASFTWEDNSEFDDYFIILQRNAKSGLKKGSGEYVPIDTVEGEASNTFLQYSGDSNYEFSIQPLYKNTIGRPSRFAIKTILTNPPTLVRLNSISDSEAEIVWKDNNINVPEDDYFGTYSFYLEVTDINGNSEIISHIESDLDRYILSNLDPSINYRIRIRSYSSTFSAPKTIENLISLQKVYENNISNLEAFDFNETTNSVLISKFEFPKKILKFDITSRTFESYDIRNGEILHIKASEETDLVALNHLFDEKDSSKVFIYDLSNGGKIIDSLSYSSDNQMKILKFESQSTLILSEFNSQKREGNILKWNTETATIDTLYSYNCFCRSENMASAFLYDPIDEQYILGVDGSIIILNSDGNKIDEINLGGTPILLKKSLNRIYYQLHDTFIGFYDLANTEPKTIYQGIHVSDFLELSSSNYFIVSDYSSSVPFSTKFTFFDLSSLEYEFQIKFENKIYGLLLVESNDRLIGLSNVAVEEFDITNKWEFIDSI